MATETVKSGSITSRDTVPIDFMEAVLAAGNIKVAVGTVEMGVADIGSKYIMCEVPSNAVIHLVEISSDTAIVAALADIGIYQTTQNGGAVVDADFFGSAVDVSTAALSNSRVEHESAVYGIEDVEKPLWEALGLASDPARMYDVVATTTVAATTGGTFSLRVWYTTSQ